MMADTICNASYAVASITPLIIFSVEDGKAVANLHSMRKLVKWIDGSPRSIKMIPVDVGEASSMDLKKILAENEIELVPLFMYHSSKDSTASLTPIITMQKILMISLAPEDKIKSRNILELFDWELWIFVLLTILTALLVRLMITHGSIIYLGKILKTSIWSTIKLITLQDFYPKMLKNTRIFMTSIIFFIFFLIVFLNSRISTDLVFGEKPFTLDELEDLLDPRATNVKPIWRKFAGVYEAFSMSGSPIRKKIWQRAQTIGVEKCMMDHDLLSVLDMGAKYASSPFAAFDYETMGKIFKILSCSQSNPLTGVRIHVGSEIIEEELLSFPYLLRNDSCNDRKKLAIEEMSRKIFEANVFNNKFIESILLESFKIHDDSPLEKWRCLFGRDPFDQNDWLQIGISNVVNLFSLLIGAISFSSLILIFEIVWSRRSRATSNGIQKCFISTCKALSIRSKKQ